MEEGSAKQAQTSTSNETAETNKDLEAVHGMGPSGGSRLREGGSANSNPEVEFGMMAWTAHPSRSPRLAGEGELPARADTRGQGSIVFAQMVYPGPREAVHPVYGATRRAASAPTGIRFRDTPGQGHPPLSIIYSRQPPALFMPVPSTRVQQPAPLRREGEQRPNGRESEARRGSGTITVSGIHC